MYYSDKPIKNFKEDILGRAGFSKNLAETIYNYNNEDSLVIGIFGKWGTGKTSILNMVLKGIETKTNDENKPIIVRFTPWGYPSDDSLIASFLNTFSRTICKNVNLKNEIGEALNKYSFMFDTLKVVPYVGEAGASVIKDGLGVIANELRAKKTIDDNKTIIEKAIQKENRKIIVAIDDIDRLTNDQIRDVFQLVKQVANFSKVIYILAMDREVVTKALSDVHGFDGEEYLEKIVQIPFEIPEINHSALENYLESRLNEILDSRHFNYEIDQNHWNPVFLYCIRPYLKTMRDVNRILNVFQFKFDSLANETCLEDLIALTVVEVTEPKLYKWIFENKKRLCGESSFFRRTDNNRTFNEKETIKTELGYLSIDSERAYDFLNTLFPYMLMDKNIYDYYPRQKMRISDSMRFDIYFKMNLEEVPVSRSIIIEFIHLYDERKLIQVIKEIDKKGNMNYFLTELKSLIPEIPDYRKEIIVRTLYKTQATIKSHTAFQIKASRTALDLANNILSGMDSKKCYRLLKDILQNGNLSEIGAVVHEILSNDGTDEKNKDTIMDKGLRKEQVSDLKKVFLENIGRISKNKEFVRSNDIEFIIYLWDMIDEKLSRKYMEEQLKDKTNCLKYVCRISNSWVGTNGIRWSFDHLNNNKYITKEEVKKNIDSYNKSDLINDFTNEELIKLASFILDYDRDEEDIVTEKEANELVDFWRKHKSIKKRKSKENG